MSSNAKRPGEAIRSRATTRAMSAPGKRSFRLPEVVVGVILVAGCALAAVVWQHGANSTTTVVVARRQIPRGALITADDLRGAEVGGETSAMISGDDAQALLGRVAVVDIALGAPLTPTLVTDTPLLSPDEALTSVALRPGELPPDLAPTDHVRLVITIDGVAGEAAVTSLIDDPAVVWSVDASPDDITTVVTIRGPISLATQVAAASSVRLVRVEGS